MCNNRVDHVDSSCDNCIAEIIKVILILQENACKNDICLETCDRAILGCNAKSINCNTRPVTLFVDGNTPISMPINKADSSCEGAETSCVCRVEKIDGCCVTCRVLAPNRDKCDGAQPFVATNSFFTTNLDCVCSIRCLPDTFIETVL